MRNIFKIIIGLHIFVGIGALFGGIAAVLNPEMPLGISPEMLENSPFSNYLIPGLFLLLVLGFGNFSTSILVIKKVQLNGIFSGLMGAILFFWILIQCYILQTIDTLHIIFFSIGVLQGLLALIILYIQDLFPVSILKRIIQKVLL